MKEQGIRMNLDGSGDNVEWLVPLASGTSRIPISLVDARPRMDALQSALLEAQVNHVSESLILRHPSQAHGTSRLPLSPRTNRFRSEKRALCIGVTSTVPGEGKTTAALQLAISLARNSFKRIFLVEMSLNAPAFCSRLGIPAPEGGVTDLLEDAWWFDAPYPQPLPAIRLESLDNLLLLPAGRVPERPERAAHSPRVRDVLAATDGADIAIIDLPSVAGGNVLPIMEHLDGLIVVVRAGVTPRSAVNEAMEWLGRDRVLGVILNGQESAIPAWLQRLFGRKGV